MPHYEVFWLGADSQTLDIYEVVKETRSIAIRSVAMRVIQSHHLVPDDCWGFIVKPSRTAEEKLEQHNADCITLIGLGESGKIIGYGLAEAETKSSVIKEAVKRMFQESYGFLVVEEFITQLIPQHFLP